MRISCPHCTKALTLADNKVPAGPFHLTCPACQKRFPVDGSTTPQAAAKASAETATTETGTAPTNTAVPATPAPTPPSPASPSETPFDDELHPLRPAERELMASMPPVAFIVDLAASPIAGLRDALQQLGMEDIRHFETLDDAVEGLMDIEAGMLLIRMDKASAPPCEPLKPLETLGYAARRNTFVVLMADNVRSLDGQLAFYLQVNCLIATQDVGRFAPRVRRALLHHLRLYRHWAIRSSS